jgi:group I intron endonuclease
MASFQGTIYLTVNQINGKIYIGQTSINKNGYIGSGKLLKKAIKKYGKDNFIRTILRNNIDSLEELNLWEDFYINLFNSRNLEIGYNIVPGGSKGGFNHTFEAIEKIKVRSNQEDNKLRIREIQKLAVKSRIGTHHSTEVKLQIVKTKFGFIKEIEIYKKDGEIVYTCNLSKEAFELTGVKPSAIRNNLVGLSKSAGGYIFKYKEIK